MKSKKVNVLQAGIIGLAGSVVGQIVFGEALGKVSLLWFAGTAVWFGLLFAPIAWVNNATLSRKSN